MLSELIVENVAVIERAEINFEEGFNVFTGETGAGKSILVDAIYAVLGARTSKNIVRTGENKATVTAVFDNLSPEILEILRSNDLGENGECILRREIGADGKSSARVNSVPVPSAVLKEISSSLMSIYGQNDSHDLLNSKNHLSLIDSYSDLTSERNELKTLYYDFISIKHKLDDLIKTREETARMRELYEYQVKEIEEANLSEDEEKELKNRLLILKNSEKLLKELERATSLIYDTQSPIDSILTVANGISSVSEGSEELENISERLSQAYYEVYDCLKEAERYKYTFDVSPGELSEIEDRLYKISVINRKYGPDIQGSLKYLEETKEKLKNLYSGDELEEELKILANEKLVVLKEKAQTLSENRKVASERFLSEVTSVLADLNMKNVKMVTSFKDKPIGPTGKDEAEFLISVNPGEEPKPLSKIASGGENSRIMLAIKSVLSNKDSIDSMIFDEIDTGVSGSGATKIGEKLKNLSNSKQIICITHQAQIAAMANCHFHIEKNFENGRTFTTVKKISGERRAEELAKIMGGDKYSEDLIESARRMIKE